MHYNYTCMHIQFWCFMSVVALCGSRSLLSVGQAVVPSVVRALVSANRPISVGCASGADAAVLSAAVAAGAASSVQVFAVGGQCGSGFAGTASALSGVQRAQVSGASVNWWSGGSASVPLRARLVSRSLACLGSASSLVAFVNSPPSRAWSGSGVWRSCGSGTWSTVAAAAGRGLPVVVFPVGASFQLPHLPGPGTWAVAGNGIWSNAFRFIPAQSNLI